MADPVTLQQLVNAGLDADTFAEVTMSDGYTGDTTTNRDAVVIDTIEGRLKKLGYDVPILYAGGIVYLVGDRTKTVEEAGVVYAPLPSSLPFTTDGTFANDASKFFTVQITENEIISITRELSLTDELARVVSSSDLGKVYNTSEYDTGSMIGDGKYKLVDSDPGFPLVNPQKTDGSLYWLTLIPEGNDVLATQVGVIPTTSATTTDVSVALNQLDDYCVSKKLNAVWPSGWIGVSETLSVSSSFSLSISGAGPQTTSVNFINITVGKVLFDLEETASHTTIEEMFIIENGHEDILDPSKRGFGTCFKMSDTLGGIDNIQNWKNLFYKVRVWGFGIGALITTQDPLDGTTHAFCSEVLFLHSKFRNCRKTLLMQNIQAVDTTFMATDIENDDAGETYTVFEDDVGGNIKMFGGSIVGRGKMLQCNRDPASTSLWQAGKTSFDKVRFEIRGGNAGPLIDPVHSVAAIFHEMVFNQCQFLMFTQTISFIDWAGKSNVSVRDCDVLAGALVVHQYPTAGMSGNDLSGQLVSYGSISVTGGQSWSYVKETSSPYGTYDERFSAPVTIENYQQSPNGSVSAIDADGFEILGTLNQYQRGGGLTSAGFGKIVMNQDRAANFFNEMKTFLPQGVRPLKLIYFKQAGAQTLVSRYLAYAVKDKADWVGGTFDYLTDAVLMADTANTTGDMGYVEVPMNTTDTYFTATDYFTSGLGLWLEGRVFIQSVDAGGTPTASATSGFIGFEYG